MNEALKILEILLLLPELKKGKQEWEEEDLYVAVLINHHGRLGSRGPGQLQMCDSHHADLDLSTVLQKRPKYTAA